MADKNNLYLGSIRGDIYKLVIDEKGGVKNFRTIYSDDKTIWTLRVDSKENIIFLDDKMMYKFVLFSNNQKTIKRIEGDQGSSKAKYKCITK